MYFYILEFSEVRTIAGYYLEFFNHHMIFLLKLIPLKKINPPLVALKFIYEIKNY